MRSGRSAVVVACALLAALALPSYAEDRPDPIERRVPGATTAVVVLHGLATKLARTEEITGLTELGRDRGFDVVYPAGLRGSWNAGWCCGWARENGVDDVDYLAGVIRGLRLRGIRQVYLAGFSNGGMMAYRYACALGPASGVDGLLVVAGTYESSETCHYTGHVLHVHGLADHTVPYHGEEWSEWLRAPLRDVSTIQGLMPLAHVDMLALYRGTHRWPGEANSALVDIFGL
jgi:poly(3-hydroxybutyrate) depolymerase